MSFDVVERSNDDAFPIVLYEFVYGTTYWRYATGEEDISVGGVTYTASDVADSGISMSGDPSDDALTVTVPASIDIANMLNGSPPSETIWLNIRRFHHDDNEAPIYWVGYVSTRKGVDSISVDLRCKTLMAGFGGDGLRLAYGRQCPHALYGVDCRVNKDAHALSFQIEDIQGNRVISSALSGLAGGWLSNGFFQWTRFAGALERRGIEIHSGNQFTIIGTASGLSVGDWITAYPGCQRTRTDCKTKFNNLSNFGGFAHLPGSSPFSGDPIY